MCFFRNLSLFATDSISFNGIPLWLGYVNPKATNFSDLFSLYMYICSTIYALRCRESLYRQNPPDGMLVVDLVLKYSSRLLKFPSLYFLQITNCYFSLLNQFFDIFREDDLNTLTWVIKPRYNRTLFYRNIFQNNEIIELCIISFITS